MLKDLFKEDKKKEEKPEEVRKKALIYLCIVIVGCALLFVGGNGNKQNTTKKDNKEEITVKKEDIVAKLDLIKTNYHIYVYKTVDDKEKKVDISRDDDISIYTGTAVNDSGYVQYKDKYFMVGKDEFVQVKSNKIKNEVPTYSYNFELLKSVANYCNFKDNYKCEVNVSDYLNEYNKIYNTTYKIEEDKIMIFEYKYDDKKITSFSYDFSEVQKLIEKKEQNIKYAVYIDNIENNDYSDQIKYFDELIKKKN